MTGPVPFDRAIRRAKLRRPPLRDDLVARPQLTARLGAPPRPALTLVVAPAGFGKTTLLTEWAAHCPVRTAWLTVDADDRAVSRFVAAVVAAIDGVAAGVGATALDLLRQPEPLPPADIGAALADALLELPERVVLVIDDYHLAASPDVDRCLDGLLRDAPPSFRLVLSSRVEPGLPLARLRLHGDVAEFRAIDLRFSDDDVRALLAGRGMEEVDAALIATIQRQIDGWIAGLQSAVLALPTLADPTHLAEAIAGEQSLLDFLVDEVLEAQSAETQDFVLRTALPEEICASLADALSDPPPDPDNERRLRRLAHDHFFLEPAGDGGWFRYHPLFRSLLLHRLESGFPRSRAAELRRRAGAWFAAQGLLDDALPLLLAAGAEAEAARLVEAAVHPALNREAWRSLNRWLRLLPPAPIDASPRLLLATAWIAHVSGRAIPLQSTLAKAGALLARSIGDAATTAAMRAEIDLLGMGTFMSIEQDPERSLAVLRRVLKRLPADHRFPIGLAHVGLAYALQTTGRSEEAIGGLVAMAERESDALDAGSIRAWFGLLFVLRQAGDFPAVKARAAEMLTLADRHRLPVAAGWARLVLGWIAYEHDERDLAIEHFAAIAGDLAPLHLTCAVEALLGLALAYETSGRAAEAETTMRRALEIVLDARAIDYLPLIRAFEARLALARGEPPRAIAWLATPGVTIDSSMLISFTHPLATRIQALLAEGSPERLDEAQTLIDTLRERAVALRHPIRVAEALALSALALAARGAMDDAVGALDRSIALAAPAELRRTYVYLGPALVPLLRRLAERPSPSSYLARLLAAFDLAPAADSIAPAARTTSVLAPLTEREVEVLERLARRQSYQEIGDESFISVNTVKSHAANIYGKLDVANRRQALVKAESLGWTPPS